MKLYDLLNLKIYSIYLNRNILFHELRIRDENFDNWGGYICVVIYFMPYKFKIKSKAPINRAWSLARSCTLKVIINNIKVLVFYRFILIL